MRRLRWWLARRAAPVPIMADPFPDLDGMYIQYRTKDPSWWWAMKVERFRMKSTMKLPSYDYDPSDDGYGLYHPPVTHTRFIGTVKR